MTKFHGKVIGSPTSPPCLLLMLSRSCLAINILLVGPIYTLVTDLRNNCFLQCKLHSSGNLTLNFRTPFSLESWGVLEGVLLSQTIHLCRPINGPGERTGTWHLSNLESVPPSLSGTLSAQKKSRVTYLNPNFCVLDPTIHSSQSHCCCFS